MHYIDYPQTMEAPTATRRSSTHQQSQKILKATRASVVAVWTSIPTNSTNHRYVTRLPSIKMDIVALHVYQMSIRKK